MAKVSEDQSGDSEAAKQALEQRLDGLMEAVRLSYLVKREGGWDSITEWGETLSLGQCSSVCACLLLGGVFADILLVLLLRKCESANACAFASSVKMFRMQI